MTRDTDLHATIYPCYLTDAYTFRLDDHVMSQQSYFPEPFLKGTKEVHTQ